MGIGKKTINKYVRIINIHKESCITNVHSSCPHSRRNNRNWVENLNNCASVFLIDLQSLTYFELYSFLALTVNYLLDGHIVRWNNYIISQWSRHYADEKVVMGNVVQQVFFYSLLIIIMKKMSYINSPTMCKFKSIGDGTIH